MCGVAPDLFLSLAHALNLCAGVGLGVSSSILPFFKREILLILLRVDHSERLSPSFGVGKSQAERFDVDLSSSSSHDAEDVAAVYGVLGVLGSSLNRGVCKLLSESDDLRDRLEIPESLVPRSLLSRLLS